MNGKYRPQCDTYWNLRKYKVSKYTTNYVKIQGINIQMVIERRKKSELMAPNKEAIMDIIKAQCKYLTPDDTELTVEAKAQLKYITYMEVIKYALPNNEYKLKMAGAVPSANTILLQFVEFYDANRNFRDSLVVSLEKTAVCKLTSSHNNPRTEEKVTVFIRVIGTYNKTCASIDSANLDGPSYRYVKILNSKDQMT